MSDSDASVANAVDIARLRYRWQGQSHWCLAIDHFELAPQQPVFLHGHSGSGKSTLLALIAGILQPDEGVIRVLGQDLAAFSASGRDHFRGGNIGFIFQQFNLIPYLSALDNITIPCRFSAQRRASLGNDVTAEAYRLAGRLDLDTELLHQKASALSVGQQQRVAAARALIGHPPLVIADEPTSALDADRQRRFIELMMEQCAAQRCALIFVSHDLRLSTYFERVVALSELSQSSPLTAL